MLDACGGGAMRKGMLRGWQGPGAGRGVGMGRREGGQEGWGWGGGNGEAEMGRRAMGRRGRQGGSP